MVEEVNYMLCYKLQWTWVTVKYIINFHEFTISRMPLMLMHYLTAKTSKDICTSKWNMYMHVITIASG